MSLLRKRNSSRQPQDRPQDVPKPSQPINTADYQHMTGGIVSQRIQDLMQDAAKDLDEEMRTAGVSMQQADNNRIEDPAVQGDSVSARVQELNKESLKMLKKKKAAAEQSRNQEELYQERVDKSTECIAMVNSEARRLASEVDGLISKMRQAAQETKQENPYLGMRLEKIRMTCIKFIKALESQLPNHATSLYARRDDL